MPSDNIESENTLNELFSRDPWQLTDAQFEKVIEEMRAHRERHRASLIEAENKPVRTPKEKVTKEKAAEQAKSALASLGLFKP